MQLSATKSVCLNARVFYFLDDVFSDLLKGGAIEVHPAQRKHTHSILTKQSHFDTELRVP